MNIGYFDEGRLFRNEEDVFLQHKQVALHSLEVGFDAWMAITTNPWSSANV
jgi:hypothetical protein